MTRLLRICRRRLATESSGPHNPLYWGATVGDQITGTQAPWDMNAVSQFEAMGGKQLSLVNFFAPFANCSSSPCSFYKFPTGPMENIRTHGAIPVFSWSSQSIPSSSSEPDFQLSDVIAGTYDSYIREFAEDARDWGHPFFLRFNWEMNGNWFPWSEGVNGNQPGEYVAAWRHVHDIFTSVGATNVTWVWCPNIDPGAKFQAVDSLYPGDEYVDWTGLDGYNWGPKKGGWTSFDHLYRSTYDAITETIAPGKPLMIAEIGSTRGRRLQGELGLRSARRDPGRIPEGSRPALVRQVRRRHGLADRDLDQRQQRSGGRRPGRRLPDQRVRQPEREPDPAAHLDRRSTAVCD